MRDVHYLNGRLVIVGTAAGGVYANPPALGYSDDLGKTWIQGCYSPFLPLTGTAQKAIYNIEFFNGQYIGIGWSSGIVTSHDGFNWTCLPPSGSGAMYATHIAHNRMIAVGGYTRANRKIKYTDDGTTWADVGAATAPALPGNCNTLQGVDEGNNRWIAVGADVDVVDTTINGVICYSDDDGVNWNESVLGFTVSRLESVIFENDRWIAMGTDTGVYSDDNGNTWTKFIFNKGTIKKIKYHNNKYYAVGFTGVAITSEDGLNWTSSNHNNGNFYDLIIISK